MTTSAPLNKPSRIARGLGLAASPTFALMALTTAADPATAALCAVGGTILPVDGMTAMSLLMSLFHLPPWLGLARRGRPHDGDRTCDTRSFHAKTG
jgi:hypothetical protein